ncbi:hypothetical protein MTR_0041s0050 [Medicago truncatula]|uniref:Uncharacterized protein n=1 Tax=Medicago truncatula TaxID=3880 RepID=A0A072TI78_MEDTR|nr:hypothetical protein MTR_0041s0050 [Medicago truncatula]
MVISSVVISTLLKRYAYEPEKQQFTTMCVSEAQDHARGVWLLKSQDSPYDI